MIKAHTSGKVIWAKKSLNLDTIKVIGISNFLNLSWEGEFCSKLQRTGPVKCIENNCVFSDFYVASSGVPYRNQF